MDDRILLFIPMYNCEKQIVRVLGQLSDDVCRLIDEVIVVNNRSTDNGEQTVIDYLNNKELPVKVNLLRNNDNYGLGGSHKVAFKYAVENDFDYVIVLHGDDQGSIDNIIPYLKRGIYKKYDCLLGARFMPGSVLNGYSKFRTFGNIVYDVLFTIGCRMNIYDLGSGLNMYNTKILKNKFYLKYKDNLVFNYCMIMGSAYYKHNIRFFPIEWREDDQVSNVKMVRQAYTVLKLLGSFVLNKNKFIMSEHRDKIIDNYEAEIIFSKE